MSKLVKYMASSKQAKLHSGTLGLSHWGLVSKSKLSCDLVVYVNGTYHLFFSYWTGSLSALLRGFTRNHFCLIRSLFSPLAFSTVTNGYLETKYLNVWFSVSFAEQAFPFWKRIHSPFLQSPCVHDHLHVQVALKSQMLVCLVSELFPKIVLFGVAHLIFFQVVLETCKINGYLA